jgi:hypothetical protein
MKKSLLAKLTKRTQSKFHRRMDFLKEIKMVLKKIKKKHANPYHERINFKVLIFFNSCAIYKNSLVKIKKKKKYDS